MSSANDNTYLAQPPPGHHVHRESEALPGAKGGAPTANYDTNVTNDSQTWEDNNQRQFGAGTDDRNVMAGSQHDTSAALSGDSNTAFNQDRPMDVKPTAQGGVAIGGRDNLPEGHANMADKLVGKTQKVAGKVSRNPNLHEKGELRESGGKAAAKGEARAPHD